MSSAESKPAPTHYDFRAYNPHAAVSYIRTPAHASAVLADPPSGPLGFDLEWRPTFKKGVPENPVALIQLASNDSIMLFQVSSMREFPPELRLILESPKIVKAGVGIQGDARKLWRDCNVSMRNCVDLSLLARSVDNPQWLGRYNSPIGLARLVERYEHKLLLKGKVSRSDWTAPLSSKQQEYAGNDAHAGYTLYKRLETMIPLLPSLPKAACYSFHVREGSLVDDDGLLWEAENPDYDPGPPPEPMPPTEAQLRRKRVEEEVCATQQASSSARNDDVGPPLLNPVYPFSPPVTTARIASGFMTKQVSGYHHSAGMQTTARNPQDQRFHSPSHINPQNIVQIPQSRQFSGIGSRYVPPSEPTSAKKHNRRRPQPGHASNRLLSTDAPASLGPSAIQVRANP